MKEDKNISGHSFWFVFFLVFIFMFCFMIMLYFYRRSAKRHMKIEMKT